MFQHAPLVNGIIIFQYFTDDISQKKKEKKIAYLHGLEYGYTSKHFKLVEPPEEQHGNIYQH